MKKNLLLATILVILGLNLSAQSPNWLWAKSAGGGIDAGQSIATDISNNVYVTGFFKSTSITFDSITLTNPNAISNLFVVKYDATGNALWARSIPGIQYVNPPSVSVDSNGDIILAGGISTGNLPIIIGTDTLNSYYTSSIFVIKYNPSGNVLWIKSSFGINQDWPSCITTDSNNNIFITGTFNSPSLIFGADTLHSSGGYQNTFIVKYNASGNVLWAKSANNYSNSYGYGICADTSGNVYVTGAGGQMIIFGTDTLTNPGSNGNAFLVKYDALGNVIWARNPIGTQDDYGYGVSTDPSGNILITGYFNGTSITFGSNTLYHTGSGTMTSDCFVAKYDQLGNVLWARSLGGIDFEVAYGISTDINGNIFVTGSFQSSSIIFGTTTINNSGGVGNYDIFIVKYDSAGNPIWAKSIGAGGSNDRGKGICTDINGNILMTGHAGAAFNLYGTTTILPGVYIAILRDNGGFIWPGDANSDQLVNNNDLLPIGLYYGQSGSPRIVTGNVWQADAGSFWGIYQTNGTDIENADCNGDGMIDANDTLAINLNFSLAHTINVDNNELTERSINKLSFVPTNTTYYPGDMVDIEVWAGTSSSPVSNLYGLTFNINYTTSLVQSGTESLTYPSSWLGTPNTNAIKVGKIDALATTAYGGITRTDHANVSGYGKIANFKFQIKTSLTSNDTLNLSFSGYRANNAVGTAMSFIRLSNSIVINQTNSIHETVNSTEIHISPNPFSSKTTITFDQEQKNSTIKIMDVLGKEVGTWKIENTNNLEIERTEMKEGIYFVQIIDQKKKISNKKIIIQ